MKKSGRATAYHEAGHMVALLVFGMANTLTASIVPSERSRGRVDWTGRMANNAKRFDGSFQTLCEQEAIVCLAGREATIAFLPPGQRRCGYHADYEQAAMLVGEAEIPSLRKKARELISAHHAEVETFAMQLLEAGEIQWPERQ